VNPDPDPIMEQRLMQSMARLYVVGLLVVQCRPQLQQEVVEVVIDLLVRETRSCVA